MKILQSWSEKRVLPVGVCLHIQRFRYKPLDDHHIRIIRLQPGSGDSRIKVELQHVSSSNKYEALSYVWGKGENLNRISIYRQVGKLASSGYLQITQNLYTALHSLRYPYHERILWIDAICIDQGNTAEKSIQVAKMDSIYKKATRVVSWLGPESSDSALALDTFRRIADSFTMSSDQKSMHIKSGSWVCDIHYDHQKLRSEHQRWTAVWNLLRNPYFTRLWIYQEINLAQTVQVVIGQLAISLEAVVSSLQWLQERAQPGLPMADLMDLRVLKRIYDMIYSQSRTLIDLLEKTKFAECGNDNDHVYALLGLLPNCMGIVPDYGLLPHQVYTDLMLAYLNHTGSLDLLERCGTSLQDRKMYNLPSWAPNLSEPYRPARLERSYASSRSTAEVLSLVNGGVLRVRGVRAATIASLTASISHNASVSETLAKCVFWEAQIMNTTICHKESQFDVFAKTLICGETGEVPTQNVGNLLTTEECTKSYIAWTRKERFEGLTSFYVSEVQKHTAGRAMFTADHDYIGLCPADAQIGDQVMILLGASFPMLLRPIKDNNCYMVVGACHVPGMMHGEVLLGPLSAGWKFSLHNIDGFSHFTYTRTSDAFVTERDPRLGSLPSGWVTGEKNERPEEIGLQGYKRPPRFRDAQNGDWIGDPRLTSEQLRKKGVAIEDIFLA
ncbi:heterokaryon incompatibility protein-domain-containing protein [Calycina marina]|uniref:Heterokaryon incompatibility protein-domain-containing protein n=1 Tax=Calycina marina TaxID=1763456 RepID=A0A9P8CE74_9HELO|nr:heterokaryon incompatibility protein-domain-containing protein [Calycina marina]